MPGHYALVAFGGRHLCKGQVIVVYMEVILENIREIMEAAVEGAKKGVEATKTRLTRRTHSRLVIEPIVRCPTADTMRRLDVLERRCYVEASRILESLSSARIAITGISPIWQLC